MKSLSACAENMENDRYCIRYTPLAYEDLDAIDDYIGKTLDNPSAAKRLLEKMERSLHRLKQFPRLGAEVEDIYLASRGYRKLVVENYLIFYIIHETQQEIVVMRILYGAREYRNLL